MQIEDESRWYDFFIWLRDLMVKAAAVSVSAVFCIFAYAMGKMDRSQQSINDLQQELAGLYREQQYLLDDIVDIDRDRSQSHYDTEYPGNHLLDVELAKRMRRLDKVVDEINVLTRYIDKRRAASEFENLVTVQTSLSGPCHIP